MRRLLFLLLSLAPQAPGLIGPPASAPLPPATTFDVTAYGADPKLPDNAPAFRRAHDKAAASIAGTTRRATVYVPPGDYRVAGPIFSDASCVRWLGDGRGAAQSSVIRAADGYSGPIFVTGLPRGTPPDARYRPDLFGKLDATAASKAGQRAGVRMNGDLFGMSQGSQLTHGGMSAGNRNLPDYWQSHDFLTVEAAVEGFVNSKMPLAVIASGNGEQAPVPFVLWSLGDGSYVFRVGYQAGRWGKVQVASYTFPDGGAAGVVRVTCQVDLKAGKVSAWVNGVEVKATGPDLPPGARFPEPGTAPGDNAHAFFFNCQYYPAARNNFDWSLYGLSVSKTPKYAPLGPGRPQTPNPQMQGRGLTLPGSPTGGTFTLTFKGGTTGPIPWNATAAQLVAAVEAVVGAGNVAAAYSDDRKYWLLTGQNGVDLSGVPGMADGSGLTGAVVPDEYRYFPPIIDHGASGSVDPWNVAQLPFTDPVGARYLTVAGNWSVATGVLFLIHAADGLPITSNVAFEGLGIEAGPAYGTGVFVWHALEIRLDGCRIAGGLWGVADLIFGANYKVYLRDCVLTGYDCGFLGYWADVLMDAVNFTNNGRWTARLHGCNANLQHLNVATTGNPQYGFVRITGDAYGGIYTIDDVRIDNEGVPYELAWLYAERHPYTAVWLSLRGGYTGLYGGVPLFLLKDMAPVAGAWGAPAVLDARSLYNSGRGPVADVDGPAWQGEVKYSGAGLVNRGTYPGASPLRVPGAATTTVQP